MKNLQNYPAIIILCILSSLYWSTSMELEFHYLAIRYKPYLFTIESILILFTQGIGTYLIISAIGARNYQVQWNKSRESDLPLNILMIELFAFTIVGLDLQFIHLLPNSIYLYLLIAIGSLSSVHNFIKNRKIDIAQSLEF